MNLQADQISAALDHSASRGPARVKVEPDQSFAAFLDADLLKQKNDAVRAELLASQQKPQEPKTNTDIAFIQEHGFRAYAVEVHDRKVAEMREKILESMGLDEEKLAKMPAEQRMAIEGAIDDEIKKRMAAASVINSQSDEASAKPTGDSSQHLISQIVSGNLNGGSGTAAAFELAFGGAQEASDPESERREDENTG